MDFEVTKMGERGQVVIPREFRDAMRLEPGQKFTVVGSGDTLIFKRFEPDHEEVREFQQLLGRTREHAKKHGFIEKDMWDAIKRVRQRHGRK